MPSLMTDDLRAARAEQEQWNDLDHARCRRLEDALYLLGIERVELVEGTLFVFGKTSDAWEDGEPLVTGSRTPTIGALGRLFRNLRNRHHSWDDPDS